MKKHLGLVLVFVLIFHGLCYGNEYQLIDLGTLGGETSVAKGINDLGQVIGTSQTESLNNHAFIWQDDVMSDLGISGAALSINNSGQVIGIFGSGKAFLWEDNAMTEIVMPPEYGEVRAYDINETGQVVGMRNSGSGHRAFLWEEGITVELGDLGGGQSEARGINDSGDIVGWSRTIDSGEYNRAFLWQDGIMSNLGTLGGNESVAFDINNSGKAVGYSRISSGEQHAFIWENDVMTDIGSLGGFECIAYSINEHDQVVGFSGLPAGNANYAFLWENNIMTDLNDLIPQNSGWILSEAWDINSNGWIVGSGEAPNGSTRAFLLVPEPATLTLLALGALALRRRRGWSNIRPS